MTAQPGTELKQCDLVMKGGITSGIVYPAVVLELKRKYRFRCIGGTSAGAIAASAVAAAEYNREGGGFDRLEKANQEFSRPRFIRGLFQASEKTRPLMEILLTVIQEGNQPTPKPASTAGQAPSDSRKTESPGRHTGGLGAATGFVRRLLALLPKYHPTAFARGARPGLIVGTLIGGVSGATLALAVIGFTGLLRPGRPGLGASTAWLVIPLLGAIGGVLGGVTGRRLAGSAFALIDLFVILLKRVPANFYGFCTGHSQRQDALTDWLSDTIDELAGLERRKGPLTFGQLRAKGIADDDRATVFELESRDQGGARVKQDKQSIVLRMVTTNLSHGQPYLLPFGLKDFLFQENDVRKLFPNYVVQHLIDKAGSNPAVPPDKLPTGYHFMPSWQDLPVIVATRLSLSFPILLSAVRLYTIRYQALEELKSDNGQKVTLKKSDLQRNWFSDGGISSNFPIHFFDAWLPTRPTFGINLVELPAEAFVRQSDGLPAQMSKGTFSAVSQPANGAMTTEPEARAEARLGDIYLPSALDLQMPAHQDIRGLFEFMLTIVYTGLFYHDTLQSQLPSYRERIVQIRLNKDEGGLNLDMPPEIVAKIVEKGRQAGARLNAFNFEHHWWVRFRVLMSELEARLRGLENVILPNAEFNYKELLRQEFSLCTDPEHTFPYARDEQWCEIADQRIKFLQDLITSWQDAGSTRGGPHHFGAAAPLPDPVLRVTPEL
jgi:predicted acylesterase/phospholipase RssA